MSTATFTFAAGHTLVGMVLLPLVVGLVSGSACWVVTQSRDIATIYAALMTAASAVGLLLTR